MRRHALPAVSVLALLGAKFYATGRPNCERFRREYDNALVLIAADDERPRRLPAAERALLDELRVIATARGDLTPLETS